MRVKVLDERGKAPDFVVINTTLVHQPTGHTVAIEQPTTPRHLKAAMLALVAKIIDDAGRIKAMADAAERASTK